MYTALCLGSESKLKDFSNKDPILQMFIFESFELMEQLEQAILNSEKTDDFETSLNEVFRIMHTIKGNAAMMQFDNISILAHSVESLFDFLRTVKVNSSSYSNITDLVLESVDFIKKEIVKIENNEVEKGDCSQLVKKIEAYLSSIKDSVKSRESRNQSDSSIKNEENTFSISSDKNKMMDCGRVYRAKIYFEDDCEMENIRAFALIHRLKDVATLIDMYPDDIVENNYSEEIIKKDGFMVLFNTEMDKKTVREFIMETAFLKRLELEIIEEGNITQNDKNSSKTNNCSKDTRALKEEHFHQEVLSVSVVKLDILMDLVGELVVSGAMVTLNPELQGISLDNFHKASGQLRKIINNLQDIVMSIRMVPLSVIFKKMNRLVRDMSKKLNKEINLEIIGAETEVDKNIIDHLSDPIMFR